MQDHVQAYFRRVKSFTHLHSAQIALRPSCRLGLNTILFQKYFKYTCIIDIQQIDQDLIVSSWLIYIISWNVHNLQQNRWFKHMGHMTWKYSMVSNGKSRNFDIEDKQINK